MINVGVVVMKACVILALLFSMPISDNSYAAEILKKNGNSDYIVNGLRQFPYQDDKNFYMGVVVAADINTESCRKLEKSKEKEGDYSQCVSLEVITKDDLLIKVDILEMMLSVPVFLHEVMPKFGKYTYWQSVILIPKSMNSSPGKGFYRVHELEMLGRFKLKNGKRVKYVNEVYR